jgi:hypothetical protein
VTEFSEIVTFKSIPESLATFVCVDSRELVVLESRPDDVRTDQGSDVAVWTTNRLLVELFEKLFNEIWRSNQEEASIANVTVYDN